MIAAKAPNARRLARPRTQGSRARVLSAAEEVALAKRIKRGDLEAEEKMIESNLRLVMLVARRYQGRGVPLADLVQEGTVGLVQAVRLFDYRRGLKFSTYAVWWIRRSMLDAIASSNVIRIPAKANQQLGAVRRAEAELEHRRPRHASDIEIAERTQLSVTTVRSLRNAARVTASLDEAVADDATLLGDLVADERAADPSEAAVARETQREVSAMLRLLPLRHREVVIRRYGLYGTRTESHEEIGARLGLGEERSRQIEREALHRLRSIASASARAA
jgi:RNA polymerase primary sigma factor